MFEEAEATPTRTLDFIPGARNSNHARPIEIADVECFVVTPFCEVNALVAGNDCGGLGVRNPIEVELVDVLEDGSGDESGDVVGSPGIV
jgi:hypothetical protein